MRVELAALPGPPVAARTCAQLDRAVGLLATDPGNAVREFMVAALENELAWTDAVRQARRAPRAFLEPRWVLGWDGPWPDPVRCPPTH